MKQRIYIFLLLVLLGTLAPLHLSGQGTDVKAEANPKKLAVGQTGTYSIRFFNTSSIPNINTPRVSGIDFSDSPNQMQSHNIVNGRRSTEIRLTWQIIPQEKGTYTIPGRTISLQGNSYRIPDVTLEVVEPSEEFKSRHFLRVDIPEKDRYYVGEAIPVTLRLYVREDVNLEDLALPSRNGDNFSQTEFSRNPEQFSTSYQGQRFRVVEWTIILTPLKSGESELQFKQAIAVSARSQNSSRRSVFDFGRSRTERVNLSSPLRELDILPVPEENRPDSYSGAIGQFDVQGKLINRDLTVGEPTTISLEISGKGNFDRIIAPQLPDSDNWKFYPPKSTFESKSDRNFEGKKHFEYILVPQKTEIEYAPELSYSFFDPYKHEFVTTVVEAKPVSVMPAPDGSKSNTGTSSIAPAPESSSDPQTLRPLAPQVGKLHEYYTPAWERPGPWGGLALAIMGVILSAYGLRKRKSEKEDLILQQHRLLKQQARKHLKAATDAANKQDAQAFFKSACNAIREQVATVEFTIQNPSTFTSEDIENRLSKSQTPEQTAKRIVEIFSKAEAAQFGGVQPDKSSMYSLARELSEHLSRIQK